MQMGLFDKKSVLEKTIEMVAESPEEALLIKKYFSLTGNFSDWSFAHFRAAADKELEDRAWTAIELTTDALMEKPFDLMNRLHRFDSAIAYPVLLIALMEGILSGGVNSKGKSASMMYLRYFADNLSGGTEDMREFILDMVERMEDFIQQQKEGKPE